MAGTEGDTVAEVSMVAAEVTADASWGVSTTDQRSFSARADSNDPSTSGLGGLEFVGRKSRNPAAFSRHRNLKVNEHCDIVVERKIVKS